jgi:23S rRNA pseudouridine1911/1915/1917 synthase
MKTIISSDPDLNDSQDEVQDDVDSAALPERRNRAVSTDLHGFRLDHMLVMLAPEFSRNYLQQLIAAGGVTINGNVALKASLKVRAGEDVQLELRPTQESRAFTPEQIPLDVVFEDADLLVINKPAGMVVHPAPGNWQGTLLNALLARHRDAVLLPRAGIVHRLDKDTSGLMVVARTRPAMDRLTKMIAAREVRREYLALAHVPWQGARTVEVNESIGRDPRNRLRMAVVNPARHQGKLANTKISLVGNSVDKQNFCMVRCALGTGRTHQIRVHMAFLGHPLVGDQTYGGAEAGGLYRQALHARLLAFEHPCSGQPMVFQSLSPIDFQAAQEALGLIYNENE